MTPDRFRLGEWLVDPSVDEIARDGRVVKLEPRKMQLLVTLAGRAGDVVTPDELLDAVWPGVVVTQSSIYQSVAQLRKTLGDSSATPEYIATVPRKGYRLIAPVAAYDGMRSAPATELTVPPPTLPVATPAVARETTAVDFPTDLAPRPARRRWLLGAGLGASAVAVGGFAWFKLGGAPPVDGIVRLAVLPFADQSEGAIEQAAADGLANDVIHRFERSESVLVLARNSTFTFRRMNDERGSLRLLKEQLNADYVLTGELFRTRERFRVAVRLLAVGSGKAVWSGVFTKSPDRLAELPNLIAAGALKALGLQGSAQPEVYPLDAYELYLLGLNAFQTQRNIDGLRKARDYFQHAIDTEPKYARAYAGVATTWLTENAYGLAMDSREAAAKAQPLIDKSLALDPTLLEGLLAQGRLLSFTNWGDGERARAFMQKAVDLYPGSAEAQFGLGVGYAFDAQPAEAVKRYRLALELDPLNYVIHSRWGQDATFLGDFESARVHFARAAALQPKYPWRFLGPAQADYARGRLDDAVNNYRLQLEQDPRRPDAWSELGWLYLDLGLIAQARIAFDKKAELYGPVQRAGVDRAFLAVADGRVAALPTVLAERGLDTPMDGRQEIDRLLVQAIAGRRPTVQQLDAVRDAMRADSTPWVGSYWIFIGQFAWVDLAALYDIAGAPASVAPLLDDAQKMLAKLVAQGNAFHTIPFFEARIAALRGQRELAVTKLVAAVDRGWRRTWLLPVDSSLRTLRDDPRLATLIARTQKDIDVQKSHVG